MKDLLKSPSSTEILRYLYRRNRPTYPRAASLDLKRSYSTTSTLFKAMKEGGLLESVKQGRKVFFNLTAKGWQVAHLINELMELLEREEVEGK